MNMIFILSFFLLLRPVETLWQGSLFDGEMVYNKKLERWTYNKIIKCMYLLLFYAKKTWLFVCLHNV